MDDIITDPASTTFPSISNPTSVTTLPKFTTITTAIPKSTTLTTLAPGTTIDGVTSERNTAITFPTTKQGICQKKV